MVPLPSLLTYRRFTQWIFTNTQQNIEWLYNPCESKTGSNVSAKAFWHRSPQSVLLFRSLRLGTLLPYVRYPRKWVPSKSLPTPNYTNEWNWFNSQVYISFTIQTIGTPLPINQPMSNKGRLSLSEPRRSTPYCNKVQELHPSQSGSPRLTLLSCWPW